MLNIDFAKDLQSVYQLSLLNIELVIRHQSLDETVSLCTDTFEKIMNSSVLS